MTTMTRKRSPVRAAVRAEVFVTCWMDAVASGMSTKQLAERLGLDVSNVYVRASTYRKAGVPLPRLRSPQRFSAKLDTAKLTAIVRERAEAIGVRI